MPAKYERREFVPARGQLSNMRPRGSLREKPLLEPAVAGGVE